MNAVPDIQPKEPGTALTVVGDVGEAMRSVQTRADIATLLETAQAITTITNADGRQQAHSVLMSLVKVRTGIDSRYEEVSASVRSFMDDLRGERDDLKKLSAAQEARIRGLRDEWDKKIAAEKKAKDEAEARRKAVIQERIDEIRQAPEQMTGQPSNVIAERIERLKVLAIDDATFAESKSQAEGAKATALVRLDKLHGAAVAHEAAQKKLEEERETLRKQQEDERRIAAIRKRIDALRAYANRAVGMKAVELEGHIRVLQAIDIDGSFEELEAEARQAQEETLGTLWELLEERKAQDAETERLAREKAEQEAATARIAEQQAELDRQRQALQVSQETVAPPSDPVEAVDGENAPKPTLTEVLEAVAPAPIAEAFRMRPKDSVLVGVVASHFRVSEAIATAWMVDFANRYRAQGEAA